jgi:hypothetical protein
LPRLLPDVDALLQIALSLCSETALFSSTGVGRAAVLSYAETSLLDRWTQDLFDWGEAVAILVTDRKGGLYCRIPSCQP